MTIKQIILSLALSVFCAIPAFSQEAEYDVAPAFQGGMDSLFAYLKTNVKYPQESRDAGEQGIAVVEFRVDSKGAIDQVKIIQAVAPMLDAEAIRVVGAMPLWVPARKDDKTVGVVLRLPIMFSLTEGKTHKEIRKEERARKKAKKQLHKASKKQSKKIND